MNIASQIPYNQDRFATASKTVRTLSSLKRDRFIMSCQGHHSTVVRVLIALAFSFHSNVEEISFITSSEDIHLKSSYDRPENGMRNRALNTPHSK